MDLTPRMAAAASLVTPGFVTADIGTDHAYIPIYLVSSGIIPSALAMDVREGPLARAREHIRESGLESRIQTRLSDGFKALLPGEADSALISGMGGLLMIRILSQSPELTDSLQELILQPQSDIEAVRHYIYDHGFYINAEHMVRDEGKYYQMFRAVPARGPVPDRFRCTEKAHFMYGRILTEKRDPVLMEYLRGKLASNNKIARELARQDTPRCRARLAQLEEEDHIICSLLDAGTAK